MEAPEGMAAGSVCPSFPLGDGGEVWLGTPLPSLPGRPLSKWVPRLPASAHRSGVGRLSPGARSFWSRALPPHSAPLP